MAEVFFQTQDSGVNVTNDLMAFASLGRQIVNASGRLNRLRTMCPGDTLFILGARAPRNLGGYSAAQLARLLAKAGLPSGVSIALVACDKSPSESSFALALNTALVSRRVVPASCDDVDFDAAAMNRQRFIVQAIGALLRMVPRAIRRR